MLAGMCSPDDGMNRVLHKAFEKASMQALLAGMQRGSTMGLFARRHIGYRHLYEYMQEKKKHR